MTEEEIAAEKAAAAAAEEAKKASPEPSQIDKELDKAKHKGEGRTELEKAIYTKKQIEARIAALKQEAGETEIPPEEDDVPVTIGMLKKIKQEESQKTALQMAEDIEDDKERELVKVYLKDRIVPSGNPIEDLKFARAACNSLKNAQIVEEITRKGISKDHSSGSGASGKTESRFEPTPEEALLMKGFGLTEADVIKAREAQAKKG